VQHRVEPDPGQRLSFHLPGTGHWEESHYETSYHVGRATLQLVPWSWQAWDAFDPKKIVILC